MSTIAEVRLWGRTIGAVSLEAGREVAAFQYDAAFAASGIELSPVVMPLSERVYEFAVLPRGTFHGLPGLLADSLPDKFGNALIDAWLATQGRMPTVSARWSGCAIQGHAAWGRWSLRRPWGRRRARHRRSR